MRIFTVQTSQWTGRQKSVLRRLAIHYGERSKGLRGGRIWQAPRC